MTTLVQLQARTHAQGNALANESHKDRFQACFKWGVVIKSSPPRAKLKRAGMMRGRKLRSDLADMRTRQRIKQESTEQQLHDLNIEGRTMPAIVTFSN